ERLRSSRPAPTQPRCLRSRSSLGGALGRRSEGVVASPSPREGGKGNEGLRGRSDRRRKDHRRHGGGGTLPLVTERKVPSSQMIQIDLAGKRGLVLGVSNSRSLGWAIAERLHAAGMELAFGYQGERLRGDLEKLTATLPGSRLY